MTLIPSLVLAQLDQLLATFDDLRARSKHDDLSDLPRSDYSRFITLIRAAIDRIGGRHSAYARQADEPIAKYGAEHAINAPLLYGIVAALREDVASDHLASLEELIHAELFADFLAMADHLLDNGFKDAAAVVSGSALEAHLLQLCRKHDIDTQLSAGTNVQPKRADRLNADLAAVGAISKLDQENVTAWLDLRNKAAHGKYDEYEKAQLALHIASVRDFILRNPA